MSTPRAHRGFHRRLCAVVAAAVLLTFATGAAGQTRPIPWPSLEGLEPAVREQLAAGIGQLQRQLGSGAADAAAFGEAGKLLHAYDFWDAAAVAYGEALEAGADPRYSYLLALVEQARGDHSAAVERLSALREQQPAVFLIRYRLAQSLVELGRAADALREVEVALRLQPDDRAARAQRGEALLQQERYQEAIETLLPLTDEVPAAGRTHYLLGMAYRSLQQPDDARRHLSLANATGVGVVDPYLEGVRELRRGERVYKLTGQLAYRAGDYAAAAEAFGRAVRENPQSSGAHVDYASALAASGRRQEANVELLRAVELDPANLTARFNLARLAADAGDVAATIAALRPVADDLDADLEALRLYADAVYASGDYAGARTLYDRALQVDPRVPAHWLGKSRALVQLERYGEAIATLESGHAVLPEDGELAHTLAYVLAAVPALELRDGERSEKLARRVFAAVGNSRHAETVALALAEQGRCRESAEWLQRAAELTPDAEGASRQRLARVAQERLAADTCRP